jgi:hypothetical protein
MYDQAKEAVALAGQIGMMKANRKPTTDEILEGLFGYDAAYTLTILVDLYNTQKGRVPFEVGDRVRVKKRYWHLGMKENGWKGYAPMFADAVATVKEISWNPHRTAWTILTEYENPYRYVDYQDGCFYVESKPTCFMFYEGDIEKAWEERNAAIPTPAEGSEPAQ